MAYELRYRWDGDKRDWMNLEVQKVLDCNKRTARDVAIGVMVASPKIREVVILKMGTKAKNRIVVKNPD